MPRRRRPRTLLNAATVVSLVLCVGTAIVWVRSYWVSDYVSWSGGGATWWAYPRLGRLIAERHAMTQAGIDPLAPPHYHFEYQRLTPSTVAAVDSGTRPIAPEGRTRQRGGHWRGFVYISEVHTYGPVRRRSRVVAVPLWAPAALTAVLPAVVGRRLCSARRRPRPGLCPACNYDLRATPGRCPECGTIAAR